MTDKQTAAPAPRQTKQAGPLDNFATALAAAKAVNLAPVETQGGREHLLVPEGFIAKDVTDPDRLAKYAAAARVFDDAASLIAYANIYKAAGAIVVADIDANKITAFLDYHEGGDAVTVCASLQSRRYAPRGRSRAPLGRQHPDHCVPRLGRNARFARSGGRVK